jgi:hypothetical protein
MMGTKFDKKNARRETREFLLSPPSLSLKKATLTPKRQRFMPANYREIGKGEQPFSRERVKGQPNA